MHVVHMVWGMTSTRERVKIWRERRGLRQRQLAEKCDKIDKSGAWPQSKICRIETGDGLFTVEDLEIVVEALGVTMPRFFRARRAA